jgi:hypothetical protein
MNRATTTLMHCFLLGGLAFREDGFLVFVLVVCGLLLQDIDHYSGNFFYVILFFWLCTSILPLGPYIIGEVECNWYFLDINIFPL